MKQFFCVAIFVFVLNSIYGQRRAVLNLPGFDKQDIHFGFYVGLNFMGGNLRLNESLFTNDTIFGLNLKNHPGFTLGVVSNLHLGETFDFRVMFPSLVFGQRDFVYRLRNSEGRFFEAVRVIESTYLSAPFELKYKSERYGNFRAFLLGGGDIGYDMVSQKDVSLQDKSVVRFKRWDYSFMVGFGFEFFLEYFKFTPQLKWNFGINDLLIQDGTPFTTIVDQMKSRLFTIAITFEG